MRSFWLVKLDLCIEPSTKDVCHFVLKLGPIFLIFFPLEVMRGDVEGEVARETYLGQVIHGYHNV